MIRAIALSARGFVNLLVRQRRTIWIMASRNLAEKYVGTFAGPIWTFIQPAATVAVYWFVFSVGFKAQGPGGMPFILYFLGGYIPWLLFSETLQASAGVVVANAYLVKKTTFPTEILPVVTLVSATMPHVILLAVFAVIVAVTNGRLPASIFLAPYYYLCLATLALGLSWLVSSLHVFSRDIAQAIAVVLNLWFWMTPIAWPEDILAPQYRFVLAANPMYYVVSGYRQAYLNMPSSAVDLAHTAQFWVIAAAFLLLGAYVFRRLKPEFADVL